MPKPGVGDCWLVCRQCVGLQMNSVAELPLEDVPKLFSLDDDDDDDNGLASYS